MKRRSVASCRAKRRLAPPLPRCGGDIDARVDRYRARGQIGPAIALLRRALRLDPDRDDLTGELALLLSEDGRAAEAVAELAALVARDPHEPTRRVRLADAQVAAGQIEAARRTIADVLALRPDVPEVRRSARALGVPLPLDGFRIDGRAAIRTFEAAGGHYAAPAVMVLDRAVTRVFASGVTMSLTHEIVRVDSKDAIDRWGEIQVPAGAEILTLRTHKADGTTREPEEITGKESVSAADLAIGDYVEWELLETHGPSEAFAPGFLAERFFFQSFDAPIARSELELVTPAGLPIAVDARAGAPKPEKRLGADGVQLTTFVATERPSAVRRALGRPGHRVRPLGPRVERGGVERLGPLSDGAAARRGSHLARGGRAGQEDRGDRGPAIGPPSPARSSTGSRSTSRRPTSWPRPRGTPWRGAAAVG